MRYWTFFVDKVNAVTGFLTVVGFALLFVCVMMQIIWRYILEVPLPWSDEAARYLLVWVSLLAIALAFRDDSHIRLDYFFVKFPPSLRHGIWILFNLMALGFLALLLIYGIPNAVLGRFTCSPGMTTLFKDSAMTMFLPYLSVPVSAGIMILNLIDYVIHNFSIKEFGDTRGGAAS
jgi:TRAP-type C4-dicarboxylate transport system permease small subunit